MSLSYSIVLHIIGSLVAKMPFLHAYGGHQQLGTSRRDRQFTCGLRQRLSYTLPLFSNVFTRTFNRVHHVESALFPPRTIYYHVIAPWHPPLSSRLRPGGRDDSSQGPRRHERTDGSRHDSRVPRQ